MKKQFPEPEMEIERFDDAIDCLSISDGFQDDGAPTSKSNDT